MGAKMQKCKKKRKVKVYRGNRIEETCVDGCKVYVFKGWTGGQVRLGGSR